MVSTAEVGCWGSRQVDHRDGSRRDLRRQRLAVRAGHRRQRLWRPRDRGVEAALVRVVAYSSLTGRPVDAALARRVLDELYPAPTRANIHDQILQHARGAA